MSVRTFARTGRDVARARVAAKRFAQQKGQFAVSVGNVARSLLSVAFVRAHDYVSISGLTLREILSVPQSVTDDCCLLFHRTNTEGRCGDTDARVLTPLARSLTHSLTHSFTHSLTHSRTSLLRGSARALMTLPRADNDLLMFLA